MAANPSEVTKIVVSTPSEEDKLAQERAKALDKATLEYKQNIKKLEAKLPTSDLKTLEEFNQSLSASPLAVTNLIGNYLEDSALETSSKIMPLLFIACKSDIEERRRVREDLLPPVFNADPDAIESLFNKKENAPHPKMLLVKASYREGYFSKKLNEFHCFRDWNGVSPLQAAYLCGDGPFLGRRLLAYLIRDNNLTKDKKARLLTEARQQLQELLDRVDEFLTPLKELVRAYNNYISQYDSLASENKWPEIEKLWEQVGECHKRLPHYVKQEFCGSIPFDPVPEFTTSPPRGECRYWNNDLLDLDELGATGRDGRVMRAGRRGGAPRVAGRAVVAQLDLAAINHLCELREADLRNTIACLQSFEATLDLIADKKTARIEL